jgi:DNA transposition AAA+ family ATPase
MSRLSEEQRFRLEAALPDEAAMRAQIKDYRACAGLTEEDFAHRIGKGRTTLQYFMRGRYCEIAESSLLFRKAAWDFMRAHPLAIDPADPVANFYDTATVRAYGKQFYRAVNERLAIILHSPPGTGKTRLAQHFIAELNRNELSKNGTGRRAYLVRCRIGIRPQDLLKRVAEACGTPAGGNIDRILRNLRFDLRSGSLLVFDEAQFLDLDCLETIRELYDLPPHVGMLLQGAHTLRSFFVVRALELQQWNRRLHAVSSLPDMSEEDAARIARAEIPGITDPAVRKLVQQAWDEELVLPEMVGTLRRVRARLPQKRRYLSPGRLFGRIAEIRTAMKAGAA